MMKDKDLTQTIVGSPIYMAPEVLKGNFYDSRADVWSFGVVLFQMLYGFCPYEEHTIPKLIDAIDKNVLKFPMETVISDPMK